jgi:hypothetical protein
MFTYIHAEDVFEVIRNNGLVNITFICKELNRSRTEVIGPLTKLWNADAIDREFIDGKAYWKIAK